MTALYVRSTACKAPQSLCGPVPVWPVQLAKQLLSSWICTTTMIPYPCNNEPVRPQSPTSHELAESGSSMSLSIQQLRKTTLLYMPVEIIQIILDEWVKLQWWAPTIARRICRRLKDIVESRPRLWSRIYLSYGSPIAAGDVREWLCYAKTALKRICIETEDSGAISAALNGATNATSLIYRIPMPRNIRQPIQLPGNMDQLLHLCIEGVFSSIHVNLVFKSYEHPNARFTCLTSLHLMYVDLTDFRITEGLLPALRRLILHSVDGPILSLIQECSGTLEDLGFYINNSHSWEYDPQTQNRIVLPKLKVLVMDDTAGLLSFCDAPNLRLIYASIDEFFVTTGPPRSVVEWATPSSLRARDFPYTYVFGVLAVMSKLQHLMLHEEVEILGPCFEFLRNNPEACPSLQCIEVAESIGEDITLDTQFKGFLIDCVAGRAATVPGFTLLFLQRDSYMARFEHYYGTNVCLFTFMYHQVSHRVSRVHSVHLTAR